MKIVYLDDYTVHLEELDASRLFTLGDYTAYPRTSKEQIVERAAEADIILTNKVKLGEDILSQLPHLKYIGVTATGYNIIDIEAARKRNIVVTNAKNYSSMSVAQQTFAMILAFANRLAEHADPQKWVATPDFCYYDFTLTELAGKKLGLIGYGDIGKKVAQIAKAFEMEILVHKKTPMKEQEEGVTEVSLNEVLSQSDYLSLHCPLTPENEAFINKENISKMKKTAFLINTSRGGLIHESDLADALNEEKIAGAALDVLTVEPPSADQPLLKAKNCKISPHIAWATLEARKKLMQIVIDNIEAFMAGSPKNVVS